MKIKRIISVLLAVMILSSLTAVFAYEPLDIETSPQGESGFTAMRAEETEWYYRFDDNGVIMRRLWSYTYGKWKTEWEYF